MQFVSQMFGKLGTYPNKENARRVYVYSLSVYFSVLVCDKLVTLNTKFWFTTLAHCLCFSCFISVSLTVAGFCTVCFRTSIDLVGESFY